MYSQIEDAWSNSQKNMENFNDAFEPSSNNLLTDNEYKGNIFRTPDIPSEYIRGTPIITTPAPESKPQKIQQKNNHPINKKTQKHKKYTLKTNCSDIIDHIKHCEYCKIKMEKYCSDNAGSILLSRLLKLLKERDVIVLILLFLVVIVTISALSSNK